MAIPCRFELLPRELRSVATGAHVGHAPQGWGEEGARGWGRIGKGGDGGGGRGVYRGGRWVGHPTAARMKVGAACGGSCELRRGRRGREQAGMGPVGRHYLDD